MQDEDEDEMDEELTDDDIDLSDERAYVWWMLHSSCDGIRAYLFSQGLFFDL